MKINQLGTFHVEHCRLEWHLSGKSSNLVVEAQERDDCQRDGAEAEQDLGYVVVEDLVVGVRGLTESLVESYAVTVGEGFECGVACWHDLKLPWICDTQIPRCRSSTLQTSWGVPLFSSGKVFITKVL